MNTDTKPGAPTRSAIICEELMENRKLQLELLTQTTALATTGAEHAHDRALKVVVQLSVLYLGGWIAVLSLSSFSIPKWWPCSASTYVLIPCLFHVATLGLLAVIEWRFVMRTFSYQTQIQEAFHPRLFLLNRFIPHARALTQENRLEDSFLAEFTTEQELVTQKEQAFLAKSAGFNKNTGVMVTAIFLLFLCGLIVSTLAMIAGFSPKT